jgi:hypothetical protein
MALKECKECSASISDSALQCPHCGAIFPGTPDKELIAGAWSLGISAFRNTTWVIIAFGLIYLWFAPPVSTAMFSLNLMHDLGWFLLWGGIGFRIIGEVIIYFLRSRYNEK